MTTLDTHTTGWQSIVDGQRETRAGFVQRASLVSGLPVMGHQDNITCSQS
jgi:hypothetical protein